MVRKISVIIGLIAFFCSIGIAFAQQTEFAVGATPEEQAFIEWESFLQHWSGMSKIVSDERKCITRCQQLVKVRTEQIRNSAENSAQNKKITSSEVNYNKSDIATKYKSANDQLTDLESKLRYNDAMWKEAVSKFREAEKYFRNARSAVPPLGESPEARAERFARLDSQDRIVAKYRAMVNEWWDRRAAVQGQITNIRIALQDEYDRSVRKLNTISSSPSVSKPTRVKTKDRLPVGVSSAVNNGRSSEKDFVIGSDGTPITDRIKKKMQFDVHRSRNEKKKDGTYEEHDGILDVMFSNSGSSSSGYSNSGYSNSSSSNTSSYNNTYSRPESTSTYREGRTGSYGGGAAYNSLKSINSSGW